jgi:hypothetical protein
MSDGRLTAVVTEAGDGTSITNAAETVIAQIQAEHPGRQVDVIEHHPASTLDGETFDLVQVDQHGRPAWTPLPTEQVRTMFGPGVFADGVGPAPRIASDDDDDGDQWYLEAQGGALDGQRVHLNGQDRPRPTTPPTTAEPDDE